jgi:tetratricopeptide (TPR) repeat protein
MTIEPTEAIDIFYCYAREDRILRDKLEIHLGTLKQLGKITSWYDRNISAGEEWEREIDDHLNKAHIILLLISPYFMHSDYSYSKEMKRAMERHGAQNARVIPIILRPVDWEDTPFSQLQVLPTNSKAVTSWRNQDEAFLDIVKGIRKAIKELPATLSSHTTQKSNELIRSYTHYRAKQSQVKLVKSELDIELNPKDAFAYYDKSRALSDLYRYREALAASERAIELDPDFTSAYNMKSFALWQLKRYEEALAASEHAIELDPDFAFAYFNKCFSLVGLNRYEEALAASERAIELDPKYPSAYNCKGFTLKMLNRYEEALAAVERAIELNPYHTPAYYNKIDILEKLKRFEEALAVLDQVSQL